MITFKGTDKDMKCRGGFQYEIGKTYTDDGAIRCGDKGFHFEYIKKLAKGNIAKWHRGHAAAQGYRGHAAAQGYRGHAAAQGYRGHAEVHGEHSIAASFGIDGTAMAEKVGSWITVYEWEKIDGEWAIKDGKCARVDGEKIKPNVRYKLKNGEFVEVEK